MTKKMGRPALPKGETKDVQIGIRFKSKENEALENAARKERQDKVTWLRQAAIAATKEWVQCDRWTIEDLHGKSVTFQVVSILEGPVKGTGTFDVWKRGDGKFKIMIESVDRTSTPYVAHVIRIYIPQEGVKLIKKLPAGSQTDFSVIDPLFQKCGRA